MSRRRDLSDDEHALWASFTRSIKPLPSRKAAAPVAKPPRTGAPEFPAPPLPKPQPVPIREPAPAPLGRRLKQRVARGREPIDARIDLHGMTQSEAHSALLQFLQRAQTDGARTVLVVTGKGSNPGTGERERGVLKRQVPLWLALPEFRRLVVAFDDAHVGHGGQGALYVRLRRPK